MRDWLITHREAAASGLQQRQYTFGFQATPT